MPMMLVRLDDNWPSCKGVQNYHDQWWCQWCWSMVILGDNWPSCKGVRTIMIFVQAMVMPMMLVILGFNWPSCKGVRTENHEQEPQPRRPPSQHSQRRGEGCFDCLSVADFLHNDWNMIYSLAGDWPPVESERWKSREAFSCSTSPIPPMRLFSPIPPVRRLLNPTCEASLPNPTCEAPLVTAPRGMPLVKVLAGEAWTSFIRQIRDKTMQKAVRKQEKGTHRRKVSENIKTL